MHRSRPLRDIMPKLGLRGQARLSYLRLHLAPISSPHLSRSAYSAHNFGREKTENDITPRTGGAPRQGGVIPNASSAPAFLLGPVDDPDALGEIRRSHFS